MFFFFSRKAKPVQHLKINIIHYIEIKGKKPYMIISIDVAIRFDKIQRAFMIHTTGKLEIKRNPFSLRYDIYTLHTAKRNGW